MSEKHISDLQQVASLVKIVREFNSKGWAPATSSNYSFRNGDSEQQFSITKSGVDKSFFSEKHIIVVDSEGIPVEPFKHQTPSRETLIHMLIYKYSNANAIFHTHSSNSTVLSMLFENEMEMSFRGYEILKGISGNTSHLNSILVPIIMNSGNITQICFDIEEALLKHKNCFAFMISGHGLYCWGDSLLEAKRHTEIFEFLMECSFKKAMVSTMHYA